ncbi:MAG: metalloregulator ArsR/SmtB family transcription factor [Chloroflexota bacterium]
MQTDTLGTTFAALVNPTRRAILSRLQSKSMNVNELREPFTISAPAISRHLKVLESAGLVTHRQQRQQRIYSLQAAGFEEALLWMEQYRRYWDQQFDALDAALKARKIDNDDT